MSSANLHDPEQNFVQSLHAAAEAIEGDNVTLRQLLELIGEQGMLLFCMFLTIPFLLPVSIPGVSTVFGLVIVLIGVGVTLKRVPWLPARLMNKAIATEHLVPAMEKAAQYFGRLDTLVRARLLVLTHGDTINRVNGLALIFGASLLMAPFGLIPFSNTLPALAILFLAVGMLQRDGYFIIAGYVALVATVIYFGGLFAAALLAGEGLIRWMGVIMMGTLL